MSQFNSTNFLERGYGYFPYIIIRRHDAIYQQIPLHREVQMLLTMDGIFLDEKDSLKSIDYTYACKKRFYRLWEEESILGNPMDMCLVLSSQIGYYVTKEGKFSYNTIPSGGTLLSAKDEIIQMGGKHFISKY